MRHGLGMCRQWRSGSPARRLGLSGSPIVENSPLQPGFVERELLFTFRKLSLNYGAVRAFQRLDKTTRGPDGNDVGHPVRWRTAGVGPNGAFIELHLDCAAADAVTCELSLFNSLLR